MAGLQLRRELSRRLGHDFEATNDAVEAKSIRLKILERETGNKSMDGFDIRPNISGRLSFLSKGIDHVRFDTIFHPLSQRVALDDVDRYAEEVRESPPDSREIED